MTITVTHSTAADSSFSTAGATAWNADHSFAGILDVANGGTGTATPALVAGTNVTISGTWPNQTINSSGGGGGGSGTVTSVAASVPAFLSVTGSPITTSGTLAISYSGTALPIANGGTALTTTPTNGQLLIGNGTGYTLAAITAGSNITITNGAGSISIAGNAGTVTSVGFTGGLLSIATATSTPAITVAGTSGGIPYFSSASTWATSAALAANALVVGGGAGAAPATVTTGTGVVTALGVNTGSSGAFMVQGSAIISTSTVNDSAGTGYTIGYRQMPQNSQTGATYTLVLADDGKHIYLNTGSTNTITVPTNASVAFPIGTVVTVVNGNSGVCTISGPTTGLQLANGAAATTRSVATKGMATMIKVATDLWYVSGAGVT